MGEGRGAGTMPPASAIDKCSCLQEVQRQAAPCPAFGGDQRILAVAEARSGPQRWRPKSSAVQPPPHFSLRWCSRLVNIRSWVPELGD